MARRKKKERKPNAEYELIKAKRNHDVRILSFDPGTRNMGIACVGVNGDKVDVIANSILTNPITSFVGNFMHQRRIFLEEVQRWVNLYKPKAFIAERFQTRGNGGPLIELVSTMNAIIGMIDPNLPVKYIVASQWKNAFNRRFGDGSLDDLYLNCLTAPHQLDATLIGCYGLEMGLQRQLNYKPSRIVEMVETTSLLELNKRRR